MVGSLIHVSFAYVVKRIDIVGDIQVEDEEHGVLECVCVLQRQWFTWE